MIPDEMTIKTISRAELVEMERLANTCDLVSYVDGPSGADGLFIFPRWGWLSAM